MNLDKCKNDFIYWIEHCCMVKDKVTQREIPIKLNNNQINFIKWIQSIDNADYLVYTSAKYNEKQYLFRQYKLWKILEKTDKIKFENQLKK